MSRVKSENAARPRRGSGPSKRPVSVLTAAFLSVLLLFSALPATNASAEGTSSHALNGFNVTRGTDQMVVYDQGETTNTNEWGYEVTVSAEGIVTKIGGNNSPIPEGGFVVSGHGTSASWLKTIVRVGMYCFANQYANAVLFSREPIEKTYSFELVPTGTNTTRITDALILYTPAWGSNTRTNEWGYEVSVSAEGRVTELGGNNHAIPAGGFVLSAHGDSIEKLTNLFYEEKVEYDSVRNVLTVTYDGRCAFGQSARAFRTISDRYASEKMSGRMGDYERAKAVIEEADAVIRNTDRDDSESCFEAERVLTGLTAELTSAFSESIGGEYRGAWVRPVETTREQVAAQVQKMKDAGINMIALEILYGEGVVFPTPEGCPYRQLDRFGGFDVLEAYVEECHLRQMELHAWCPNMFCGNTEEKGVPKEHPDWLVKDNRGRTGAETEYGVMYFINPFCKEATDALLDMYRYLFTTYDLDAFQLDYIRYPGSGGGVDWGYNDDILAAFRKKTGFTPSYNTSASYWDDWCAFRADAVTDFVRSVRRLIDTVSPGTLLSADVGADVNSAPRTIYQDYGLWLKLGLIDLLHPMTYGGTDSFREWVKNVMDVSCGVPVAPGTGIYIDGITAGDMADQVQAARELGCVGVVHFQINSYLGKSCGTLLTASAYGTDSRAPGRDALGACGTAIDVFLRRAALHSESAGVPTAAELESLRDAADDLRSRLTAPDPDISALKTLLSSIDSAHAGSQRGLFSLLSADLLRLERLMTFLRPAPESYVTVPRGTAVSAYLESEHLTGLFLRSGYAASDDVPVATGMYYEAEGVRRTAVVLGDTSGDGRITSSDYLRCKRHVLRTAYLTGPFEEAAKLSGKQAVGANDYLQIKRHVLRLYTIRDR